MQAISHRLLRVVMAVLLGMVVVGCGAQSATSTPEAKSYTIGMVSLVDLSTVSNGFKDGMKNLGYVEGQNLTYIDEGAVGDFDKLEPAIQRLIAAKPDLLFILTTPATLVAKELTADSKLPVVFAPLSDPVGAGIVPSLLQPGGNLTGVTTGNSNGQRLEWFLRIAPNIKRPLLPYNPNDPAALSSFNAMMDAAGRLNLDVVAREIPSPEALDDLLTNFPTDVDSVILLPDSLVTSRVDDFVRISYERKLPISASNTVVDGPLMAFGADFTAVGEQSARIVDTILKGADPADIPVETSEYFLQLNLATAEKIGLDIPESIVSQAHKVMR